MAQMVLTGLVIMADRIVSNTAYFPPIAVEELPRNYNPNRGERVRRKPVSYTHLTLPTTELV